MDPATGIVNRSSLGAVDLSDECFSGEIKHLIWKERKGDCNMLLTDPHLAARSVNLVKGPSGQTSGKEATWGHFDKIMVMLLLL